MKFYTNRKKIMCLGLVAAMMLASVLLMTGCCPELDNEIDPRIRHNVPYVCVNADGSGDAYVFYEDGMFCRFFVDQSVGCPNDFFTNEVMVGYDCYGDTVADALMGDEFDFSDDGSSFERDGKTYVASGIEHGIYFGDTYVDNAGRTIVFANDGTAVYGGEDALTGINWSDIGHRGWGEEERYVVSVDGETLLVIDLDTENFVVFERGEKVNTPGTEF